MKHLYVMNIILIYSSLICCANESKNHHPELLLLLQNTDSNKSDTNKQEYCPRTCTNGFPITDNEGITK